MLIYLADNTKFDLLKYLGFANIITRPASAIDILFFLGGTSIINRNASKQSEDSPLYESLYRPNTIDKKMEAIKSINYFKTAGIY